MERQSQQAVTGARRAIDSVRVGLGALTRQWWHNPLLRHARMKKALPLALVRRVIPILAGALFVLSVAAWIIAASAVGRALAAGLVGISLAAVLLPVVVAAPAAADRITRQMRYTKQDPRRLGDLPAHEVVWGLSLVTLWRLRWLLLVALAFTPALMLGVLRLDISSFTAWRESAQVLGGATDASRAAYLLSDGRIPYFRLVLRAVSAGIIPWVLLPLLSVFGVTCALLLDDASLSPLAGLIGGVLITAVMLSAWQYLTRSPLLAGPFEVMRMLVIASACAGVVFGTKWLNDVNADLLMAEDSRQE